ncbi:MAG: hypothetical protein Q7J14_01500 [Candidatus Magasanikbacteria bacterium]|nr:hypothetical protein [Candidatus Magasanikbacteria bacterium]
MEKNEAQIFFNKESKSPILMYPFPKLDPEMDMRDRRYHFNAFLEWEKKYLIKIEILTNLAEKIFISQKNTGILMVSTTNKMVFIVFTVLEELLKKTAKKEFEKNEKKIVWEVINRHIASQKEKLKKFAQL